MTTCRYCEMSIQPQTAATTRSYWQNMLFPCHLACKIRGERDEAIVCQTIDADCNDCRFFKRGQAVMVVCSDYDKKKKVGVIVNVSTGVSTGHCLKFDQPTKAYPNKWTGRLCFEHRRS
jgi:ribosomal protein L36